MAILIFFAGFLLRFLMLLSGKSLWGDEWFSVDLAGKPAAEIFASVTHDVHPPFFYAALHLLVQGLGYQEWVFRLIPFLSGAGTVWLVYVLSRKITGNEKSALTASFLVAVSPYWLQLSNEIRSYGLLGFLSCLGTLLLLRLADGRRTWRGRVLYALAALSTVYLEHYGWFWFLGVTVYVFYLTFKHPGNRDLLWLQAGVLALCLPALGISVYQVMNTEPVFLVSRVTSYHSLPAAAKKLIAVFWHFACGPGFSMLSSRRIMQYIFKSPNFWFFFALTCMLFGLCLKTMTEFAKNRRDLFILFLFMLFFPILCLLIFYPIRLHSRYLSFAAPYFFILIGHALTKGRQKIGASILLVVLAGSYLYTDYQFIRMKTDPVHREDYPSMIRYAFEQAGSEDVICGFLLSPEIVPYYERRFKLSRSAAYFDACYKLAQDPALGKFNKIWFMGYMDMDQRVNTRNLALFKRRFKKGGFNSMSYRQRFGGEDGLNSVYVFEK